DQRERKRQAPYRGRQAAERGKEARCRDLPQQYAETGHGDEREDGINEQRSRIVLPRACSRATALDRSANTPYEAVVCRDDAREEQKTEDPHEVRVDEREPEGDSIAELFQVLLPKQREG